MFSEMLNAFKPKLKMQTREFRFSGNLKHGKQRKHVDLSWETKL